MPFPEQTPGVFTEAGISLLPDALRGVYGLFRSLLRGDIWVYVGKGEIKNRLQAHRRGDNTFIMREAPTHFVIEATIIQMDDRERELILELDPICNRRVG